MLNPHGTYQSMHQIVMDIRTANQKIKTTNQYVKSPEVDQYLMHEQEWTIRILLMLHDLNTQKISKQEIMKGISLIQENNNQIEIFNALSEDHQKLLLLSLTEILAEMKKGPEYVSAFLEPAKP